MEVIITILGGFSSHQRSLQARSPLPARACLNAHVARVLPDDDTAYVVCEGDHVQRHGSVLAFSVKAQAALGFVDVGLFPDGMAILPPAPR